MNNYNSTKVFSDEEIINLMKKSKAIDNFFSCVYEPECINNYLRTFLTEYTKVVNVTDDLLNEYTKETSDAARLSRMVWNAMIPYASVPSKDKDGNILYDNNGHVITHNEFHRGWKPFDDVFSPSIKKRLEEIKKIYVSIDTESVIFEKNRNLYATASEEQYKDAIHTFVENFGWKRGRESQIEKFLNSWFKIIKRGFTTSDSNRGLALFIVGEKNACGKTKICECLYTAICEYFNVKYCLRNIDALLKKNFLIIPKTSGVVYMNDTDPKSITPADNSFLKGLFGNDPQDFEVKGINDRAHTLNHNVYIGTSNGFMHLPGEEDTRLLNLPLEYVKYNVSGQKNWKKHLINFIKHILNVCPECDEEEFRNIIDELPKWNQLHGDKIDYIEDLYNACEGNVEVLEKAMYKSSILTNEAPKKLYSKSSMVAKLIDFIDEERGHKMGASSVSILTYKLKTNKNLFIETYKNKFKLNPNMFDEYDFLHESSNQDMNYNSRPWNESPIFCFFNPHKELTVPFDVEELENEIDVIDNEKQTINPLKSFTYTSKDEECVIYAPVNYDFTTPEDPIKPNDKNKSCGYICKDAKESEIEFIERGDEEWYTSTNMIQELSDATRYEYESTNDIVSLDINELDIHTSGRPATTDHNFFGYNYLCESDEADLTTQFETAMKLFNDGVASRIVYSGGKSIHVKIQTNEDVRDSKERKFILNRIGEDYFNGITLDAANINTGRKCRTPNQWRRYERNSDKLNKVLDMIQKAKSLKSYIHLKSDDNNVYIYQTQIALNDNNVINVSKYREEYKEYIEKETRERVFKDFYRNSRNKGENFINDYHNLPAVKTLLNNTTSGCRDVNMNSACYAMKNNGYESEISALIDEVEGIVGHEIAQKFRRQYC